MRAVNVSPCSSDCCGGIYYVLLRTFCRQADDLEGARCLRSSMCRAMELPAGLSYYYKRTKGHISRYS